MVTWDKVSGLESHLATDYTLRAIQRIVQGVVTHHSLPGRQYLISRQGTCHSQSPVQTRSEGTSTPLYSSFVAIVQKNVQHDHHPFEHDETETK